MPQVLSFQFLACLCACPHLPCPVPVYIAPTARDERPPGSDATRASKAESTHEQTKQKLLIHCRFSGTVDARINFLALKRPVKGAVDLPLEAHKSREHSGAPSLPKNHLLSSLSVNAKHKLLVGTLMPYIQIFK